VYEPERVAVAGKLLFRSIARLRMLEHKRLQPVRRFARFNDRNLVQAFEYCGRLLTEQCLLAAVFANRAKRRCMVGIEAQPCKKFWSAGRHRNCESLMR
jgi:hypothetical protein